MSSTDQIRFLEFVHRALRKPAFSLTRFLARPGHGKGACRLRGWAGELRSTAGSRRDQTVPKSVERVVCRW
jgi:hypothetical protein